jgi:membrane-associated phospholipid phosphatase
VRTYEALSAAYFLLLAIVGLFAPADRSRRAVGCLCALAGVVLVSAIATTATAVRDWAPLAYIAAGYWIPSLFVTGTAARPLAETRQQLLAGTVTRFERWLLRVDTSLRRWLPSIPAWTVPVFEVAYLACYPLVPIGFLLVFIAGSADDVNRFWNAVLPSGYACYGTLPWLQSRPPRLIARPPHTPPSVAHFNVFVLSRISHGWNTFPSGHAAMSFAVALALVPVSVPAAIATAIVAIGVAIGAAAGRYHFAIDVVVGAAVALVGCALVFGL